MPCPCSAQVVPLQCPAAKGVECVFPIWFTQCGRVWFTLARPYPYSAHAILWPCRSSQGHGTAQPSRYGLLATCPHMASSIYHMEFHEDCYQKHTIPPHKDPFQRLKRLVAAHYKKDDLLNCRLAVRMFLATTRTFMKDTAVSKLGSGAAWHVWIKGTAWQGNSKGAACYVWIGLYATCSQFRLAS